MITVIGLFQEPSWVFTNKEKCTAFTNLLCVIHVNQCFKKIILSQMETTGFMNNGNDIIFTLSEFVVHLCETDTYVLR